MQAILAEVTRIRPELTAFFGCLYYAALRPAEAVALCASSCALPSRGWGQLTLTASLRRSARAWTSNGTPREPRGLKHRPEGAIRTVPIPPQLARLLRWHDPGTGPYESYLDKDAEAAQEWPLDDAAIFTGNLLGPKQGQDMFAMVAALAMCRRSASLEKLYSGNTLLHALIDDASDSRQRDEFADRFGAPFRHGETDVLHGLRALAALALTLASDQPDSDRLRAALAWYAEARSTPMVDSIPWTPAALAGDDESLRQRLELLAAAAGPEQPTAPALLAALTLRRLAQPTVPPDMAMLLCDPGQTPGQPSSPSEDSPVAKAWRWLRGWVSRPRSTGITVLFDRGREGTKAQLNAAFEAAFPAILLPGPERMSLFAADQSFQQALDRAWQQAGHAKTGAVLWRAETSDGPQRHAIGESVGAAFAVVLDETRRLQRPLGSLLVVRRLLSTNAVIGKIDDLGYMQSVEGYKAKLAALGAAGKVIIPETDHLKALANAWDLDLEPPPELVPVGRWKQYASQARHRSRRVIIRDTVAVAILAVVLLAAGRIVELTQEAGAAQNDASRQGAAALSGKLATLAVANLGTHLGIAQLLAVEATRIDNTPQARSALFQAATASPGLQRTLQAGAQVTALAAASDGDVAVAGTSNGHLVWFDLTTGRRMQVAAGSQAVKSVAVNATGTVVAAASRSQVFVWRMGHAPAAIAVQGAPSTVAVSPSGGLAAVVSLTASGQTLISLRNVLSGGQVTAVDSNLLGYPPTLGFPSDAELLVSGTLGESQRYAVPRLRLVSYGHPGGPPANGFAFGMSPNGVFTGYVKYGSISVWRTANVNPSVQDAMAGTAPSSLSTYLAFSDDGKRAASVENGTITVSPMTTVNPSTGLDSSPAQSRGVTLTGSSGTSQVSFLGGSDERLVSATGTTLALWDLQSSAQIGPPTGIQVPGFQVTEAPAPLTISPDGRYLAMIDGNPGSVSSINRPGPNVWVYRNGPKLTQAGKFEAPGIPIWSGDELLLIDDNGRSVKAVTPRGQVLGSWQVRTGPLTSYIFNGQYPSGKQIFIPLGGGIESFNPQTRSGTYRPVRVSGSPHLASEDLQAISPDGKSAILLGSRTAGSNFTTVVYVNLVTGAAHVVETGQVTGAPVHQKPTGHPAELRPGPGMGRRGQPLAADPSRQRRLRNDRLPRRGHASAGQQRRGRGDHRPGKRPGHRQP